MIPLDQVVPLWIDDFYDGPISGFCLVADEKYYFFADPDKSWGTFDEWRYFLYPVTDEEFETAEFNHKLFEQHVGTQWTCYNGSWTDRGRSLGIEEYALFEAARRPFDYDAVKQRGFKFYFER